MRKLVVLTIGASALLGTLSLAQPETVSAQNAAAAKASPLSSYPGFGHNRAADEARYIREEAERERMIASCMRDAGFRYNPAPSVAQSGPMLNPGNKSAGPIDQNERYARSLSDEERTHYYMALYGVPDPNDPENLWDPESATGGGCSGEALRALPGVFAARSALMEEYETLFADIRKDARVTRAEAAWAECARGKGLGYSSPAAAYADLDVNPSGSAERARTIAACADTSGLDTVAAEVRADYEARFVAGNKAVLDRKTAR